jgi:hypothetical protein
MAQYGLSGGDKVLSYLREQGERLSKAHEVSVGFLEGATEADGTSTATVAFINEFGAPAANIPARPMMRMTIRRKSSTWGKLLQAALKQSGGDSAAALAIVGAKIKAQIQESIDRGGWQRNAPSTVASKGKDTPLVDTGDMLRAVDYEVT